MASKKKAISDSQKLAIVASKHWEWKKAIVHLSRVGLGEDQG